MAVHRRQSQSSLSFHISCLLLYTWVCFLFFSHSYPDDFSNHLAKAIYLLTHNIFVCVTLFSITNRTYIHKCGVCTPFSLENLRACARLCNIFDKCALSNDSIFSRSLLVRLPSSLSPPPSCCFIQTQINNKEQKKKNKRRRRRLQTVLF